VSAPWYADHANLARLVRWLELYDLDGDVLELLDKPWHWDAEWKRCEAWLPPAEACEDCDGEGRLESSTRPDNTARALCDACDGSGKAAGRCRECRAGTHAETLVANRGLCFRCRPCESPGLASYWADLAKDERGVA